MVRNISIIFSTSFVTSDTIIITKSRFGKQNNKTEILLNIVKAYKKLRNLFDISDLTVNNNFSVYTFRNLNYEFYPNYPKNLHVYFVDNYKI